MGGGAAALLPAFVEECAASDASWGAGQLEGSVPVYRLRMEFVAAVTVLLLAACTSPGSSRHVTSTQVPTPPAAAATSPTSVAVVEVPPQAAERFDGGCGATQVYKSGALPDWATVNAPRFLPYVVARPGVVLGYLFSHPLAAGATARNKILWYVGTPRRGHPLEAEGHPLGALSPTATFSKAADSWPGEIYPTGPTVPSAGCWHFTLTWQGGDQRAEVDLLFQ